MHFHYSGNIYAYATIEFKLFELDLEFWLISFEAV